MSWTAYGSFVALAVLLVLVPGQDFAVVSKNTLSGGRARGRWTAAGVASSNAVQGSAAAAGLGTLIVNAQPVFQTIKWIGAAYLLWLGVNTIRAAAAGRYDSPAPRVSTDVSQVAVAGWRQGFLSNITNPKVLVFYLSVLPQFLPADTSAVALLAFALTHALLSASYLLLLVAGLHRIRRVLIRRRVRRALDTVTGVALLGFGARLAVEHA